MQETYQVGFQKKEPKQLPLKELIRINIKQNKNNNKSQLNDEFAMLVICVLGVLLGLNLMDILG